MSVSIKGPGGAEAYRNPRDLVVATVGRLWGCRKRPVSAPEDCGAGAAGRSRRGRAGLRAGGASGLGIQCLAGAFRLCSQLRRETWLQRLDLSGRSLTFAPEGNREPIHRPRYPLKAYGPHAADTFRPLVTDSFCSFSSLGLLLGCVLIATN